jgi:hypothetical protein
MSQKALMGSRSQKSIKNKAQAHNPHPTIEELDEIFGAPPLIQGEDIRDYETLEHQLRTSIKPIDIIDEIWLQDILTSQWEIIRLKNIKVAILKSAQFRVFGSLAEDRLGHGYKKDILEGLTISEALTKLGFEDNALTARAFVFNLKSMNSIETQISQLEMRRDHAYHAIESRRLSKIKNRQFFQDLDSKSDTRSQ